MNKNILCQEKFLDQLNNSGSSSSKRRKNIFQLDDPVDESVQQFNKPKQVIKDDYVIDTKKITKTVAQNYYAKEKTQFKNNFDVDNIFFIKNNNSQSVENFNFNFNLFQNEDDKQSLVIQKPKVSNYLRESNRNSNQKHQRTPIQYQLDDRT